MDVVELLSSLVSIVSVNDPVKGVKPGKEASSFIRDYLVDHGVEPVVFEVDGFYSVFGSIGEGIPCLMFLAHYDTVPVDPGCWSYDPFKLTIVGDRGYGRGAVDDKANVAALLVALTELSKRRLPCRILYGFTGDEEVGGACGAGYIAHMLHDRGELPKYLVNADGVGFKVIVRRRKIFKIIIEVPVEKRVVYGRVSSREFSVSYPVVQHSHSAYFIHGVDTHPLIAVSVFVRELCVYPIRLYGGFIKTNVIPERAGLDYVEPSISGDRVEVDIGLKKLLEAILPITRLPIETEKPSDYGVTINPNLYEFDRSVHRIYFDMRAMISDRSVVEKALKKLLEEILPEARFYVRTCWGGYQYTPKDSPLVRTFTKVLRDYGLEPVVGEGAGASDSRYYTTYGVEAVDFGPHGGGVHGCNEYVEIPSLKKLPAIYQELALRIISKHSY